MHLVSTSGKSYNLSSRVEINHKEKISDLNSNAMFPLVWGMFLEEENLPAANLTKSGEHDLMRPHLARRFWKEYRKQGEH